jgi:predicted dehydrogenase
LIWLGIHWLDLVMHLSDSRITDVTGFAGNVGGQPLKGVEDSAALAMKFENGMFGTFTSGYYLDRGYHTHIRLWGADGWLEYGEHLGAQETQPLKWYSTKEPKTDGIQVWKGAVEPKGYTPYVALCVRACAGLQPAPITGREGLRVLRTIFAFYDAAASGKTVAIPVT